MSLPCSIRTAFRQPLGVLLAALLVAGVAGCQPTDDPVTDSQGNSPLPSTDPVAIETPPPDYPAELACDGVGGQANLLVSIGPDGTPADVRIEKGTRVGALDAAAVAAVRTWKFKPATARGRPVATKIRVPVTFTPPTMRPDMCFKLDEDRRSLSP